MHRIRIMLAGVMLVLFLSGVTAFPLPMEVRSLCDALGVAPGSNPQLPGLLGWLKTVREGLNATEGTAPFLFYGTDWLAFAHLVIALLFVGPFKDPVRNIWVIRWGVYACALVIPLALICGPIRGIPATWQLIDCSFGVIGIIPLLICVRYTRMLSEPN